MHEVTIAIPFYQVEAFIKESLLSTLEYTKRLRLQSQKYFIILFLLFPFAFNSLFY